LTSKDDRPGDAAGLRRRAEAIARGKPAPPPENLKALSPEETRRTLHELHVHQIELEMQNEELRRAQVELDAARARYFDLYDLAPVGYCTVSEQGLILEANLTAASLLGVARGALVGQRLTSFILPEDEDIYYLHRKELFETGAPQACELRMVRKVGTTFWAHLEATAAEDAAGQPVCRVVMSDNPERKRAEEALRESEQRYRSLFENMLDGFAYCQMLYDDRDRPVDWVYLEVNTAFQQLTGLRDVLGKRVSEVIPGIREVESP
jgi:PAS domain S-box-containing protein